MESFLQKKGIYFHYVLLNPQNRILKEFHANNYAILFYYIISDSLQVINNRGSGIEEFQEDELDFYMDKGSDTEEEESYEDDDFEEEGTIDVDYDLYDSADEAKLLNKDSDKL
jgi:hypothetical protein